MTHYSRAQWVPNSQRPVLPFDVLASAFCRVIVGIAGLLLLILVCAAACCGCMIPSEECFQRLGGCIVLTRARCWCDCCGWRRKNGNDWVDPELPAPQHCEKHGKASPSKHHPKKMESIQEESPKGDSCGDTACEPYCERAATGAVQGLKVASPCSRMHVPSETCP